MLSVDSHQMLCPAEKHPANAGDLALHLQQCPPNSKGTFSLLDLSKLLPLAQVASEKGVLQA